MPRIQTDAKERTEQNHRLVETVSARVGQKVTLRQAIEHNRRERRVDTIKSLTGLIEIDLAELEHVGMVLALIKDFRIQPGGYATLNLVTDGNAYAEVLTRAALASQSSNLIIDLYLVPKPDLDEDDDEAGG